MTTNWDPNFREKMLPYFCEKRWKVRWNGFLMRWRWPRIGREGGLGGSSLCFVLVWSKNLKATARRRRRERDEYSNMSSMFDLLFLI